MSGLQVELETVTPLYMGGAFQQPEFRIPSVKGLLRYWYRALDPKYRDRESVIFGSTSTRQSGFLMRLVESPSAIDYVAFIRKPQEAPPRTRSVKSVRSGLRYILFPFGMDPGRVAISEDQRFKVDHMLSSLVDQDTNTAQTVRRALIASWWALSNIGGLGARSRRGMGSIRVFNVISDWPEAEQIPLASSPSTALEWFAYFKKGLDTVRRWFGTHKSSSHITLSKGCHVALLGPVDGDSKGYDKWEAALDGMGQCMRQYRDEMPLPDLVSLGLPFARDGVTITGKKRSRGASPFVVNVVPVRGKYFMLVMKSTSSPLDSTDTIVKKRKKRIVGEIDLTSAKNLVPEFMERVLEEFNVIAEVVI